MKAFGFYKLVVTSMHSQYYNDMIELLSTFLVILLSSYKRYSICLISLFVFFELFSAFIFANNIESFLNSLFGFKIYNYFPSCLSHFDDNVNGTL